MTRAGHAAQHKATNVASVRMAIFTFMSQYNGLLRKRVLINCIRRLLA
jgi:hypothetical protein